MDRFPRLLLLLCERIKSNRFSREHIYCEVCNRFGSTFNGPADKILEKKYVTWLRPL